MVATVYKANLTGGDDPGCCPVTHFLLTSLCMVFDDEQKLSQVDRSDLTPIDL